MDDRAKVSASEFDKMTCPISRAAFILMYAQKISFNFVKLCGLQDTELGRFDSAYSLASIWHTIPSMLLDSVALTLLSIISLEFITFKMHRFPSVHWLAAEEKSGRLVRMQ